MPRLQRKEGGFSPNARIPPGNHPLASDDGLDRERLCRVDLRTGDAVHWLRIEGGVDELYDVVALAGVRRPMALGFKTDEIRRVLSIEA
jgi:hypothetical protein